MNWKDEIIKAIPEKDRNILDNKITKRTKKGNMKLNENHIKKLKDELDLLIHRIENINEYLIEHKSGALRDNAEIQLFVLMQSKQFIEKSLENGTIKF